MKSVLNSVGALLLAGSIAAPFLTWRHSQTAGRDQSRQIQRQRQEIEVAALLRQSRWSSRNNNFSTGRPALSEEQLRELLRLRGEAAALRRHRNENARPAANAVPSEPGALRANGSVVEGSDDERAVELGSETLEAMKGVLQVLERVLGNYALEHDGKSPADFSEIRRSFPKVEGTRMPGLYTFQFVREGGPEPGDTLVLKEQSWRSRVGSAHRIYGFSNGQAIEVTFADDDNTQRNFARWENEHLPSQPAESLQTTNE